MSIIEVDPKQNRLVAVLIVAAIAAVAVVVIRLHGPVVTRVAAQTGKPTSQGAHVVHGSRAYEPLTRNPFQRPSGVVTPANASSKVAETIPSNSINRNSLQTLQLAPAFIRPIRSADQTAAGVRSVPATTKLDIVLLATAGSRSRLCGIIKVGDSQPRVVAVGDIVAGDYKVKELTDARIVLTNGRDELVVNRQTPQTADNERRKTNE